MNDASAAQRPLGLFEAVGVEIEYAIVDRGDLRVRPIADRVLRDARGAPADEVEHGALAWSNELVRHVIELKTNGPAPRLAPLGELFAAGVREIDARLAPENARLLPTAMHPWMDPAREAELWPHGQREIYATFDRLFDCRGHGWSNLQSVHLNLPFAGDAEFARLHAAIRLVLPLLPALAASSPLEAGRRSGSLDTRLVHYRRNQQRVPCITGCVIPERAFSRADYQRMIFDPIERAIDALGAGAVLEAEWLNSRGAIARFSRGSIEIRLLDVQEAPCMDLAIAGFVVETLRALVAGRWAPLAEQQAWDEQRLAALYESAVARGGEAALGDPDYARLFGAPASAATLHALLEHLAGAVGPAWAQRELAHLLAGGCLAARILRRLPPGAEPPREGLRELYRELADCLHANRPFGDQPPIY